MWINSRTLLTQLSVCNQVWRAIVCSMLCQAGYPYDRIGEQAADGRRAANVAAVGLMHHAVWYRN